MIIVLILAGELPLGEFTEIYPPESTVLQLWGAKHKVLAKPQDEMNAEETFACVVMGEFKEEKECTELDITCKSNGKQVFFDLPFSSRLCSQLPHLVSQCSKFPEAK
jgi:hypothetical protein